MSTIESKRGRKSVPGVERLQISLTQHTLEMLDVVIKCRGELGRNRNEVAAAIIEMYARDNVEKLFSEHQRINEIIKLSKAEDKAADAGGQ